MSDATMKVSIAVEEVVCLETRFLPGRAVSVDGKLFAYVTRTTIAPWNEPFLHVRSLTNRQAWFSTLEDLQQRLSEVYDYLRQGEAETPENMLVIEKKEDVPLLKRLFERELATGGWRVTTLGRGYREAVALAGSWACRCFERDDGGRVVLVINAGDDIAEAKRTTCDLLPSTHNVRPVYASVSFAAEVAVILNLDAGSVPELRCWTPRYPAKAVRKKAAELLRGGDVQVVATPFYQDLKDALESPWRS